MQSDLNSTPPSIYDPERMKLLGEFTPVPHCYLYKEKNRKSENVFAANLSRSRDESREEEDVFEQTFFAVPIPKNRKFTVTSSEVEEEDEKDRIKQLILYDDFLENQVEPVKSEMIQSTSQDLTLFSELEKSYQQENLVVATILAKFGLNGNKDYFKKVLRTLVIKIFKDLDKYESLFENFPEFVFSDLDKECRIEIKSDTLIEFVGFCHDFQVSVELNFGSKMKIVKCSHGPKLGIFN